MAADVADRPSPVLSVPAGEETYPLAAARIAPPPGS